MDNDTISYVVFLLVFTNKYSNLLNIAILSAFTGIEINVAMDIEKQKLPTYVYVCQMAEYSDSYFII